MVWKCCLPIFSVLATVLLVLPTIGEGAQQGNLWRCHRCQAGTFVAQECSTSSGTRCAPCPAGTFTDHLNLLFRCIRCSTCLPGQVEQIACNREHDTLCVAEPVVSSGDIPEEESKFSNMFPDEAGSKVKYSEIPQLPKVEKSEEEPIPEELSGESPIKPHLFDMDAIEPVKAKKPTEEVTTVGVSEEVTTARLPENEAAIDDLIPIQEVKVDAQPTTAAVDTNVDGSGTVTLVIEEYPEEITKAPVQLEVAESEAPKTSPKPEIESAPSTLDTTLVIQQVPELVTEAAFDTFNEIGEPIKPSVPVSNASETVVDETTKVVVPASVPASTPAAQVEVTTTLTDAAVDSTTSFQLPLIVAELDSGIESEEQTDSSIDSGEVTETTRSFLVTSAPAVDTSTVDEPFLTTTVLLKKLVAPLGDTIDEDVAMRNKTSLADIIPLLSTTPRAVEDSAEHVATTTPEADEESTLKDVDGITSAVPIDLTTLEHAHLWINGSELLQEPAVDSASSEENKHLDVAIAAVICGIGLVVLAVIGVRYCVKKRSFKDMRRAQEDEMRIQMNDSKDLKRKDSQTDDSFQTAIYDDIELQAVNGGGKHLNGKANGHCKDSNAPSPNNEIMSALNSNYRPADDTNTVPQNTSPALSAPVETLYAVPNKLVQSGPAEPLLDGNSQTTEQGETTTTPGFLRLDILDNLKYIDETTDEEGEYVSNRMYLRQTSDEVYSTAENLLLLSQGANNLDAIDEETTPMLRRQSDDQS